MSFFSDRSEKSNTKLCFQCFEQQRLEQQLLALLLLHQLLPFYFHGDDDIRISLPWQCRGQRELMFGVPSA